MSRPSRLPPRAPFHRKPVPRPDHEPCLSRAPRFNEYGTRHQRSFSQSSALEDQPAWFDDLLSDSESIPKRVFHCRSASDSLTLFDGFVHGTILSANNDNEHLHSEEGANGLESAFVYGPNSPRRKSNIDFSESSTLLALSDYASQNKVQFVDDVFQNPKSKFDSRENCRSPPNVLDGESKTGKRHPGQRSRARKLQYIAELERTVNVFQTLESELATRCSTLLQERVLLSMENNKLKQQMAKLQQQKLIMDGEYHTLRKEAERLKLELASLLSNNMYSSAGPNDADSTEPSLQTLNWKKLHL